MDNRGKGFQPTHPMTESLPWSQEVEAKHLSDQKAELTGIILLPRLTPSQRPPPPALESLAPEGIGVIVRPRGFDARWLIRDANHTHTCQNATTLAGAAVGGWGGGVGGLAVGGALNPSPRRSRFAPFQLQLQIFSSSTRGSRPSKYGDYSTVPGGATLSA